MFTQNIEVDSIIISIRDYNFKKTDSFLKNLNTNNPLKSHLTQYSYLTRNKGINTEFKPIDISLINSSNYLIALNYLNKALSYRYYDLKIITKEYPYLIKALDYSLKTKNKPLICEVYKQFLRYYKLIIDIPDDSHIKILSEYKKYHYDNTENLIAIFYKTAIEVKNSKEDINNYQFNEFNKLNSLNIPFYKNEILIFQGNFLEYHNELNKAINLYKKSIKILPKERYGYIQLCNLNTILNTGVYYYTKKEYRKAIEKLNYTPRLKGKLSFIKHTLFDYWLSKTYEKMKLYDSAYFYINKSRDNQYILEQEKQLTANNYILEKYQNEKLRANNLKIDGQRKETRNWLIGTFLLLLFTGTIAYFINKNAKRKQLLAEKDKTLQIQKVSTLLKEQELTSIDAMIAGQEKERQRIANDLHDDLGALMATIKLHLNAINTEGKRQISQIDVLINEAYNKIRSMAHSCNAGVMAQDGLLKALHKVAYTVNQSKQLHINIASHGLENRLENSLELSIFRITQELITNIIKHAKATEATIHLTQHDDSLNIMVEDNGIGFNLRKISTTNGMGIHSIDKRIEHLNGTINIESTPKQGTTVIIDIPL